MHRMRVVATVVLIAGGLLVAAITSASSPAPASAAPSAPTATTGSASNVASTTTTLNGTVNPNGNDTNYYFEYGPTTSYGSTTPTAVAGAGASNAAVSANLAGLNAGTTYHYRLVATSSAGTTNGADQTFTTTSSQAVVLGHEGFVSPGLVVGVQLGCFQGTNPCAGHVTMAHGGTVIAERDYSIPADSGGFQNMTLNSTGRADLKHNSPFHLLGVTVTATSTDGKPLQFVIHLARWVWH